MSDKGTEPSYDYEPIDAEYIEDLEHKVLTIKLEGPPDFVPMGKNWTPTENIVEDLLNTGWTLDNHIVCRPFVMLFFSREREGKE